MTDASTGVLIYMQARYYDPGVGRFVSEDPAYNGSNWFSYCGDDPVNHSDPNGLFGILDLGTDAMAMEADGDEAAQDLGILARVNSLCTELEELTDIVVDMECDTDPIKNEGVLDEIESLGRNPDNWRKAYFQFSTMAGETIKVHAFVEVIEDLITAIAQGATTPWCELT